MVHENGANELEKTMEHQVEAGLVQWFAGTTASQNLDSLLEAPSDKGYNELRL